MSTNRFLRVASKDNEKGNLITGIRIQTSCFNQPTKELSPSLIGHFTTE